MLARVVQFREICVDPAASNRDACFSCAQTESTPRSAFPRCLDSACPLELPLLHRSFCSSIKFPDRASATSCSSLIVASAAAISAAPPRVPLALPPEFLVRRAEFPSRLASALFKFCFQFRHLREAPSLFRPIPSALAPDLRCSFDSPILSVFERIRFPSRLRLYFDNERDSSDQPAVSVLLCAPLPAAAA